jgi:hypothetical protein
MRVLLSLLYFILFSFLFYISFLSESDVVVSFMEVFLLVSNIGIFIIIFLPDIYSYIVDRRLDKRERLESDIERYNL